MVFEDAIASLNFYDYNVSVEDENGYTTTSFKYDIEIPIEYTVDTKQSNEQWSRSLALPMIATFDKYTGDLYREKNETISGKINYYNIDDIGGTEEMNYTNINWDDKTYKIGVRTEAETKWEEKHEGSVIVMNDGSGYIVATKPEETMRILNT